jgi:hypothetical protein
MAAHDLEHMRSSEDAHAEPMQGHALKLLTSGNVELLKLPMKILGRYASKGDGQHFCRRHILLKKSRHPPLHRVRFPRARAGDHSNAVSCRGGNFVRNTVLIKTLIPRHHTPSEGRRLQQQITTTGQGFVPTRLWRVSIRFCLKCHARPEEPLLRQLNPSPTKEERRWDQSNDDAVTTRLTNAGFVQRRFSLRFLVLFLLLTITPMFLLYVTVTNSPKLDSPPNPHIYVMGLAAIVMTGFTALIYSLHTPTRLGRRLVNLYKEYRAGDA